MRPDKSPVRFGLRNRMLILVASPPIVLLALAMIGTNLRSGDPWLNWFAGLVLWVYLFALALRRRLVLRPDGLEYTDFFATVSAPWTQVTRLVSRKALGFWNVEGLEFWTASPNPKDQFIDLTQFDKAWRDHTLGSALRDFAPKLLEHSSEGKSAA